MKRPESLAGFDAEALLRDTSPAPWQTQIPVLGVRVDFESDAKSVIESVEEAYGHWLGVDVADAFPSNGGPVRIRILLESAPGLDDARVRAWLPARDRLAISAGASAGAADERLRRAVARVTPALLARTEVFRTDVLDALTLFVLTSLDRTPLHAAAVVRDDVGLALTGPGGAGKSTLAYAAWRAGMGVLADDAVYVQCTPRLRVWGFSPWLHLTDEAQRFFPELAAAPRRRRPGGWKRAVRLSATPGDSWFRERVGLCVMERGRGPAGFDPMEPDEAVAELVRSPDPGFDRYAGSIARCARQVAASGGAWRLRVGANLPEAVRCLGSLIDEISRREF